MSEKSLETKNQTSEQSPALAAEHKRLEVFVGKWNTEGQVLTDSDIPAKLIAVDTYEWLPGKFFLLHRVDAQIGEEKTEVLEIIGYDASSQTYRTHSFDSQGNSDTFQANLHDRIWTIEGKSARFKGEFSSDSNTLTGEWEQSSDGSNWKSWMNIKLTKVE